VSDAAPPPLRARLEEIVADVIVELSDGNSRREVALPACRRVIQLAGSSIKAVHRLEPQKAVDLADQCEAELRIAQSTLEPYPKLQHAGFLHDAEKEYVEARVVIALVDGAEIPDPSQLDVSSSAWMRGVAEAASEMRRHLLDRMREGDLDRAEYLLGVMDEVYDALLVVDFPDALTGGLRRTLDALRGVLERSRGDVTTTIGHARLLAGIEWGADRGSNPAG
jgi:translin